MPTPKNIVIFGATSAIAQAVARELLSKENAYILVGRSKEKLDIVAQDLRTRGAQKIEVRVANFTDSSSHQELMKDCWRTLRNVDLLLLAHGDMPQEGSAQTPEQVLQTWQVNGTSMISLASYARPHFETQKRGCLCVISSVAGERGRKPTYVYGAAKAGVTAFCQALRQALAPFGVQVLNIKPGYVDTPMTAHLSKSFLFASPERVAKTICRAIKNKANRDLMVPWFWVIIMNILKLVPERLFLKLKI
jgi:decaprenylphospho-beta-D-erythro-pentofuranosid-2-ulose 2-reductase